MFDPCQAWLINVIQRTEAGYPGCSRGCSDGCAPEPHHFAGDGDLVVLDRLVGRVLRQKARGSAARETLDGRSRLAGDLIGYRRDHDVAFARIGLSAD
jgi:hypothetical protein